MICDCELTILNVNARYPGSTHDAFIWKSSAARQHLIQMQDVTDTWVLGDSGYPLEPWLLTPILYASPGSRKAKYTEQHIRSRNAIERCFVLHNMCVQARLPEPDEFEIEELEIPLSAAIEETNLYNRGLQVREDLINRLF
ncbi:hypothetical protein ACJJTC_018477 [Scirpophaga incertulas]